jgi:hypothetical protein
LRDEFIKENVFLFMAATGLIVANLYCQPLIVLIADNLKFLMPMQNNNYLTLATLLDYFFMVPLGDKLERKTQILYTTLLL